MTPIKKALAQASTVQGAHRALEHKTTAQVRILDREGLRIDAWNNIGNGPQQEQYVADVLALYDRSLQRGDGVVVYENHDLGHPELGERQYVSYGGQASQLETRGDQPAGQFYLAATGDSIPTTLPDIGGRINWRYQLVAIAPPVRHETAELDGLEAGGRVDNSADHS